MPFDALTWINNRYRTELSFETHPQVFTFSILWNIFEREKCNKRYTPRSFQDFLRGKNLSVILAETDSALNFYKNRYVYNGQVNQIFQTLNLRKSDYPELVKNVLLDNTIDLESKVSFLLLLLYQDSEIIYFMV